MHVLGRCRPVSSETATVGSTFPTQGRGAERSSGQVSILRWPEDADGVELLRLLGTPRLLLVAPDAAAPETTDCCEDWVRLPATDDDVRIRAAAVAARAVLHTPRPDVLGDGRIVFRDRWVPLSQIEEAFLGALAANFGSVVPRSELLAACPDRSMTPNAIRVHVMRMRRRISPLGLVVRTVHGRGYVLEAGA